MAKVKEFKNWKRIIFEDRTILKSDLRFMSWNQIKALDDLEVTLDEDNGETLVVSKKV